jgi:methionyl aminopeptidase
MSSFSAEKESADGSGEKVSADSAATTTGASPSETSDAANSKTCGKPGCNKTASLACPTCIKLKAPPARFCGQECFKEYWNEHKKVHEEIRKARDADPSRMSRVFKGFNFSGTLRPWKVTDRSTIPEGIEKPDYADHPNGYSQSEEMDKRNRSEIRVYTEEEIAGIKEACRIGREVLDAAGAAVAVGVTADALDKIVHEETVKRGAYPSPLNYYNFPKSVCTSVNEVICHGIPDMRPLEDGDIVNLDISVYYNGYHGDLNETFFVGNVNEDSVRLVECAYTSLKAAIDIAKPGTLYRDVGEQINSVVQKYHCSIVRSYCGHGIGSLFHTSPNVPHYAGNKAKGTMRIGHIFTIEPMINLGQYQDFTWPDNWTAVTRDGSRSAQFEHTMLVTEDGVELLTGRPGEPLHTIEWTREKFQR